MQAPTSLRRHKNYSENFLPSFGERVGQNIQILNALLAKMTFSIDFDAIRGIPPTGCVIQSVPAVIPLLQNRRGGFCVRVKSSPASGKIEGPPLTAKITAFGAHCFLLESSASCS